MVEFGNSLVQVIYIREGFSDGVEASDKILVVFMKTIEVLICDEVSMVAVPFGCATFRC